MRYITIDEEILKSKAWNSLNPAAVKTYLNISTKIIKPNKKQRNKCRLPWDTILNNGDIGYSENDAIKMGLSKGKHNRGINDLIDKGFVEITCQGGIGIKNKFKIIDKWKSWDENHKGFYKKRFMPVGMKSRFKSTPQK